ncbi:MAG: hypothetical protein HYV26_04050 [Candidatus Hydrogenedentes bacterium]|nr:hypothetical protein [Candidatus Hydrogenedentota bacterium]
MKLQVNPTIQVLRYTNVILNGWRVILAVTLVAFLIGVSAVLSSRPKFESVATLAVYPPPFKVAGGTQEIASLMPATMHVKDYETIITSDAALHMVREKLAAAGLPDDDYEEYSEISMLKKALAASIDINQKTAYGTEYSKVISLSADAESPGTAAILANTWAKVTQDLLVEYSSRTKKLSSDYLGGEYENVSGALESYENRYQQAENLYADKIAEFDIETENKKLAMDNETDQVIKALVDRQEQELRDLKAEKKLHLREAELTDSEDTILAWEEQLREVRKDLADTQERLKQLESELQQHDLYLPVSKAITDDAIWDKLTLDQNTGGLPPELESLKLREETLNPVHLTLMESIADTRVELNTLPQQEQYLLAQLEVERGEFDTQFIALHQAQYEISEAERRHGVEKDKLRREREDMRLELTRQREEEREKLKREATLTIGRLNRELEQQKDKYKMLASQSLGAKLALADSTTDIAQIGEAVPVDKPAGVPRTALAIVAAVIGLVFGVFLVAVQFMAHQLLPHLRTAGLPGGTARPPSRPRPTAVSSGA